MTRINFHEGERRARRADAIQRRKIGEIHRALVTGGGAKLSGRKAAEATVDLAPTNIEPTEVPAAPASPTDYEQPPFAPQEPERKHTDLDLEWATSPENEAVAAWFESEFGSSEAAAFQGYEQSGGLTQFSELRRMANEMLADADTRDWVKSEIEQGHIVDLWVKSEISSDSLTVDEAREKLHQIGKKLQDKLPGNFDDIWEWSGVKGRKADSITGSDRGTPEIMITGRHPDPENRGDMANQYRVAAEHATNDVSLSPLANTERILKIAIEAEQANSGKKPEKTKQAVFEAIKAADWGYARDFQGEARSGGGCVLASRLDDGGQWNVGYSGDFRRDEPAVRSVKKKKKS
jgi:hypothetical protein